ncbi:hypothetical protein D0861_03137 [Hortaea werneckii]|uniref:Cyclin N-terminal domain-containing protein n=1 Tax=Hortaea werneckii TaxID=91943 RepID=A0A3M7FR80_HORWE|nr:hypothetical protein D0861_03137 [Hortaea werneckii]
MSSAYIDSSSFGHTQSSQGCGQYPSSVTSSASSSQDSIFSDTGSTQSSIASSISDDFRPSQEDATKSTAKDSATQMVEVIWPLSVVPCSNERESGRSVLPLRTYIEETLRRSRTSYSTLQVALYYLVLVKPFVPKTDFTMEQAVDCPANRALMCGRRMFLAALILASKYLQDRNYSAKAWSKMSGLRVEEINTNERTFLAKICWKLHIAEPVFKRWTDVVLRYTPSTQPPSPGQGSCITWKSLIPVLTPDLEKVPLPPQPKQAPSQCPISSGYTTPTMATPRSALNAMQVQVDSTSQQTTPTPHNLLPRYLEPKPELAPPTPALARMGPLPTPQLTPSSVASNTPAASACSSRRPSISSAMAMAQKSCLNRCTMDSHPGTVPTVDRFQTAARRPSISTASSGSSPESMMSDRSRSSRASSISSVSTVSTASSMAPNRAYLARQATCRNVPRLPTLPTPVQEEKEGTVSKPIIIGDDTEMNTSPEMIDFSVNEKALHAPHRHSKNAPHHSHLSAPAHASTTDKGRKRARPRGSARRSDLQEEVRLLLEEELDAMDVDYDDSVDDRHEPSPSPAATTSSTTTSSSFSHQALSRTPSYDDKETQPPPSLSRQASRIPVQKNEGKKRTCYSSSMSISPSPAAAAAVGSRMGLYANSGGVEGVAY